MHVMTRTNRWLDRFDILAGILVVDYAILVTNLVSRYTAIAVVLPIVLTVRIAQLASGLKGIWLQIGQAAAALGLLAAVADGIWPGRVTGGLVNALFAIAMFASFILVATHVLRTDDVTARTMLASLCVYLLLGLCFALIDTSVGEVTRHFFLQRGKHDYSDYSYFSFITLTTVGYGDLTPFGSVPRACAVLEAISGQIVLVTLVARTVSSATSLRHRRDR